MAKILVVDDDEIICPLLRATCNTIGHEVILTHRLDEGLKAINSDDYDLVLLDIHLPDGNGLETLPRFRDGRSKPDIIIMTAQGDPDGAEMAINAGVWDYIPKPVKIGEMSLAISRALQFRKANREFHPHLSLKRDNLIGESQRMVHCLDLVAQAAGCDANVLVTGETGTALCKTVLPDLVITDIKIGRAHV
jgi:two-component system NtrC family response regulator